MTTHLTNEEQATNESLLDSQETINYNKIDNAFKRWNEDDCRIIYNFFHKVYSLLTIANFNNFSVNMICLFVPCINMFMKTDAALMGLYLAGFIMVGSLVLLLPCKYHEKYQVNLILALMLNLSISYGIAWWSCKVTNYEIIIYWLGYKTLLVIGMFFVSSKLSI